MKPLAMIVVFAGVVSSLRGQAPLYLQDGHGVAHGPYVFATGETVRVGGAYATVVRPSLKKLAFQDKVEHTVIPEINFKSNSIFSVAATLQRLSGEYVPAHLPIAQGEVRIEVDIEDYALPYNYSLEDSLEDPFAPRPYRPVQRTPPAITLSARYVNLVDVISIVCDIAGLDYRIGEDAVTIYPINRRRSEPAP
jgi:hypothetical protein